MEYSKKIISGLTVLLVLCVVAIIICACFRTDLVTMLIFVAVATVINIIGWGVLRIRLSDCEDQINDCKEYMGISNSDTLVRFDDLNEKGEYRVVHDYGMYKVVKGRIQDGKFIEVFVVRTFIPDGTEKGASTAKMRAYSLRNHITQYGKLWPTSKNHPETGA